MYKAIIFDLDDTLYDYESIHKNAMKKLRTFTCEKFGISENEFDMAFSMAKKETKELLGETGASHNRMLYCQKTLENLGKNPVHGVLEMYDCYWDSMLSEMKLRNGTIQLLERLKADNVKIAICTDLTTQIQHRKINQLGLDPYIDVLVTSEEAGVEKPNERIYGLAFAKLQALIPAIKKSDCLFIGDSQEKDVDAPRCFGMDSILFTNMNDLEKKIYL
ncbi:MAG: HAD family hydrolase [Spirochaetaceae bacterium]|nr:HAD family hydrolase [Spirochaetaceae bacterium]